MAASMNDHDEQFIDAGGTHVEVRRGGQGAQLLVIHGELGVPGWLEAYAAVGRIVRRDRAVPAGLRQVFSA